MKTPVLDGNRSQDQSLNGARFGRLFDIAFGIVVFLVILFQVGVNTEPRATWEGFIVRSQQSLLSTTFFLSDRPFTIDLLYKLLLSDTYQIVVAQRMFSAAAWGFLGYALAGTLNHLIVRMICLALFSFASLSWNIFGWTAVILSESFTFSLLALWLAVVITYLRLKTSRILSVLCLVTILLSFTRQSVPFLLATCCFSLLILAALGRFGQMRPFLHGFALLFCLVMCLFIVQLWTARIAVRQWGPLGGIITKRMLPDQDRRNWFQQRGMPVNSTMLQWSGLEYYDKISGMHIWELTDEDVKEFTAWLRGPGISTYVLYLLSHPWYVLMEPVANERRLREVLGYDVSICFQSPGSLIAELVEKYGQDWKKVARFASEERGLYEEDGKTNLLPSTALRYWLGYRKELEVKGDPLNFFPNRNKSTPFLIATLFWGDSRTTLTTAFMAIVPLGFLVVGLLFKPPNADRDRIARTIPGVLVIAVVMHVLTVYHGDANSVARHSVLNGVIVHAAFFMSLLALVDTLLDSVAKRMMRVN